MFPHLCEVCFVSKIMFNQKNLANCATWLVLVGWTFYDQPCMSELCHHSSHNLLKTLSR